VTGRLGKTKIQSTTDFSIPPILKPMGNMKEPPGHKCAPGETLILAQPQERALFLLKGGGNLSSFVLIYFSPHTT
jgi:hypothetical protein